MSLLAPVHLSSLATSLVDAVLPAGGPPEVVRIRRAGGAVEIATRATGGDHPCDHLVGLRADPDWLAVGVRARGRARSLDDPADEPGRAVVTVHLVATDGSWASEWRHLPADEPAGPGRTRGPGGATCGTGDDPGAPQGLVADACCRVLGLATPPPEVGSAVLWSVLWLDAVLAAASTVEGRSALGEPWRAIDLHPAVRHAARPPGGWSELAHRAAEHAERHPWSRVRRAAAAGTAVPPVADQAIAGWHDDGSFARAVLAALPDLDALRVAVPLLLPPSIATPILELTAIQP